MESKILNEIRTAKTQYEVAVKNGMGVQVKRQTYMNYLFNNADSLIEAALDVEDLLKQHMNDRKKIAELQKQIDELSKTDTAAADAPSPKKKG